MIHSTNNVKVKAEEVTARPLVSDLPYERGYCHVSCWWLAIWERLLPCLLPVTCYVKEATAMPLASDLSYERGYCHVSCQWLAIWERLLPCLLPVTCYVREATAMPLASDLLCERGYCHTSFQRLAMWEVIAVPLAIDALCETRWYLAAKWPLQSFGRLACFATGLYTDMTCIFCLAAIWIFCVYPLGL